MQICTLTQCCTRKAGVIQSHCCTFTAFGSAWPRKGRCIWRHTGAGNFCEMCQGNNGRGPAEVSCRSARCSRRATVQSDCTHCESVICMQPTSGRRSAAALLEASRHGDGSERHSRPQGRGCRLLALLRCPGDAPQRHVCQSGWPCYQSSLLQARQRLRCAALKCQASGRTLRSL